MFPSQDWDSADLIKAQLKSQGVHVDDKNGQWSATDGRSGRIPNVDGAGRTDYSTNRLDVYAPGVPRFPSIQTTQQILLPLQLMPPVHQAMPTVVRPSQPGSLRTALPSSGNISTAEINRLLATRTDARRRRDWELADSIKAQLRVAGVEVDDKVGQWTSADNRTGIF